MGAGIIERYREQLPVGDRTPIVSLCEGGTPLIALPRLARELSLSHGSVYAKFEGLNPTGSFKDRGMTLAVSKALEEKAAGVLCASTGNTAASAAAYAARAGLPCVVLLPKGAVAAGKLGQALVHGARVLAVKGNFDAALSIGGEAARELGYTVVNSSNPYRLEGQKTAAFEIVEQLGRAPDFQFMPVGNAGNITAYWRGYREENARRRCGLPKMMGFQAKGADPIVRGRPIAAPKTLATAIRIGRPVSWKGAVEAKEQSGGVIDHVSDAQILAAYRRLALEGVFCEPSSAAGVAGLVAYAKKGFFKHSPDCKIVCVLTGHGLKDPETPLKLKIGVAEIEATLAAVRRALKTSTRRPS